jgi:hypothetical protein
MSKIRVWHSSRDAYHCTFRFIRLLIAKKAGLEIERLRILDMFLLFPPLLHRISMPQDVKATFKSLNVDSPERIFINLPSPAAIFQDLRVYQNSAVAQIIARGLLGSEVFKQGVIEVSDESFPKELYQRAIMKNEIDGGLTKFLVGPFSEIPLRGSKSIYSRAGLPNRTLVI